MEVLHTTARVKFPQHPRAIRCKIEDCEVIEEEEQPSILARYDANEKALREAFTAVEDEGRLLYRFLLNLCTEVPEAKWKSILAEVLKDEQQLQTRVQALQRQRPRNPENQ
jgi:hypothetical protein